MERISHSITCFLVFCKHDIHNPTKEWENGIHAGKNSPLTMETVRLDDEQAIDEFDRQVIEAGMQRVRADRKKLRAQSLLGAVAQSPAHLLHGRCPSGELGK
ncbi:MAG: hypothetical protein JO091_14095 [Acidobacteriaceae bacterium]|nr:hypothetical protein [Acidobacteriaceae bacterium]